MSTQRTRCTDQTCHAPPWPTRKLDYRNHVLPGHPLLGLWLRLSLLFFITIWGGLWVSTVSWADSGFPESVGTGQLHLREDLTRFPQGVAGSQLQVLEDPSGSATLDQIL